MDRLSDAELHEFVANVGALRVEVGQLSKEATALRETVVPRAEHEERQRRVRLYVLAGLLVLVVALLPLLYVLGTTADAVRQAKSTGKDLLNDQYTRALSSYDSCSARNGEQERIAEMIRQLRAAEAHNSAVSGETRSQRLTAYDMFLSNLRQPSEDCSTYMRQADKLKKIGAVGS